MKEGIGKEILFNGEKTYEGQFKYDWKEGWGVLTYKSGLEIEGQFERDKSNGVVRETIDGKSIYVRHLNGELFDTATEKEWNDAKAKAQ